MIENKIVTSLLLCGNKQKSELLFLKSLKKLQKVSKKTSSQLIALSIVNIMPLLKLQKKTNRKTKKKHIKIFPILIQFKLIRINNAIKSVFRFRKKPNKTNFLDKFTSEIFLYLKKDSTDIKFKKENQKQGIIKKRFLFYYK
uniref:ribosomal protein S7 n=1 Tax=Cocconeiopsis kantsiensis TaxID=3082010 RepID=UPI00300308EF